MSIWGHRDGEPSAEEHQVSGVADAPEPAAEHQDGEPAPAFWRAQGETPAPLERDPADAPPVPVLTGVVVDGESAVKDPGLTGTEVQEPAVGVAREPGVNEAPPNQAQEPAATRADEPAAAGGTAASPVPAADPAPPGVISPQRWSEILVGFVDDPRGSVQMAADAVDEAIDGFVNSVRARQRGLAAAWQGTEADTEQLRTALREYRNLGQRVQQLDLGAKTGG